MGLTGEHELYGELLIVYNFGKTIQIGKQQMGTLISCESACESDDKGIGIYAFKYLYHCGRVALVGKPFSFEIAFYKVDTPSAVQWG